MRGKNAGVQKRILDLNNKALYMPCASHSLNLVVCDAAKSSAQCVTFFGILQRIYTLFSGSTARWAILKENVTHLTVKSLSDTRWESHIESVKVLRFYLKEVHGALEALVDHAQGKKDGVTASEAQSIAKEIITGPFMVSIVIWHEVLFHINKVSKLLQSPTVSMETLAKEAHSVILFLQEFRETGFMSARTDAQAMIDQQFTPADNITITFPAVRQRKKRALFDYEARDDRRPLTPEEQYRRDIFLPLVDKALTSIKERFSQLDSFNNLYGFLFSTKDMETAITNLTLLQRCERFAEEIGDVDAQDMYREIGIIVRRYPPQKTKSPFGMLCHIYEESLLDMYPNLSVALRILLTVPVTVASAERSFSKLKLLKNYMRSTMSQDRLNGLAEIAIEHKIARSLEYSDIIEDFAAAKARKVHF